MTGDGDRLAAELLLVAGATPPSPLRVPFELHAAGLAKAIETIALDHLRTSAMTDGVGADLAGSKLAQRLALLPGAPPDRNGNGSNQDEALEVELARIAAFARAAMPRGVVQPFLPWAETSSELEAPLAPGPDPAPASWRVQHGGPATVRLAHLGGAMWLRALAARRLLAQGHGAYAGRTSEEGLLGLMLAQQLLAAEETLLGALSTATSGGLLGALPDPASYDPDDGPRWFPAAFRVHFDAQRLDVPVRYSAVDVASDLGGLAMLLEASAETVWAASAANPSPRLQRVFRGEPFPPPDPGEPPPPVLNWQENTGPLITFRCGGCHLGYPTGGFQIDTMQMLLQGGTQSQLLHLTMVVPGDHEASWLYHMLTGPPPPFEQMPQGSSLPPNEIQLIADWIDAGALEFPPTPPQPPVVGQDLLRVCYCNLVALHFDPATGALHHRYEGDGGSGIATAVATGAALRALRAAAAVMPGLELHGLHPADVLAAAARFAATQFVDAEGRVAEDVDFASGQVSVPAALAGQAAVTAGLLAAVEFAPEPVVAAASLRASHHLLEAFADPASGVFRSVPDRPFARYTPSVLADLLAALRRMPADTMPDGPLVLERLLAVVRPVLAPAEWGTAGEVLGDGVADTDGNGVPEPAAAGGPFGRLPLLGGTILVGDVADAPPPSPIVTWSQHVRPLLFEACGACHFTGSTESTYRLDTRRLLTVHGVPKPGVPPSTAFPLLVPFDAEASLLYRKLVDRIPPVGVQMPLRGTPMGAAARGLVRQWIESGASSR